MREAGIAGEHVVGGVKILNRDGALREDVIGILHLVPLAAVELVVLGPLLDADRGDAELAGDMTDAPVLAGPVIAKDDGGDLLLDKEFFELGTIAVILEEVKFHPAEALAMFIQVLVGIFAADQEEMVVRDQLRQRQHHLDMGIVAGDEQHRAARGGGKGGRGASATDVDVTPERFGPGIEARLDIARHLVIDQEQIGPSEVEQGRGVE